MSGFSDRADVLAQRGATRTLGAPIVSVAAAADGSGFAALADDGTLLRIPSGTFRAAGEWVTQEVHDGGLCLVADVSGGAYLSGGEDGRLVRTRADGTSEDVAQGRRWVEAIAVCATHIAWSSGKVLTLCTRDGAVAKTLDHPSTVTGIAFDAKGKRVGASHYNGASLWFVQAKIDSVRALNWKGSHLGIAIHPAGDALVTSMQENDMHGWRLADSHNMRMSGYPRQVRSFGFTPNGRWLVTSGADAVVLWPFFAGGPMGKPPIEVARIDGVFVSSVCAHPKEKIVAAGFEDGTLVLAEIEQDGRVIVVRVGSGADGGKGDAVSSIVFSPGGGALVFGTESGLVGVVDLSAPE